MNGGEENIDPRAAAKIPFNHIQRNNIVNFVQKLKHYVNKSKKCYEVSHDENHETLRKSLYMILAVLVMALENDDGSEYDGLFEIMADTEENLIQRVNTEVRRTVQQKMQQSLNQRMNH